MNWEIYTPSRMKMKANKPRITIYKSGDMWLNDAAMDLVPDATRVNLFYDAEAGAIGIKPDAKGYLKMRLGRIAAKPFLQSVGLFGGGVKYYDAKWKDGMFVISVSL